MPLPPRSDLPDSGRRRSRSSARPPPAASPRGSGRRRNRGNLEGDRERLGFIEQGHPLPRPAIWLAQHPAGTRTLRCPSLHPATLAVPEAECGGTRRAVCSSSRPRRWRLRLRREDHHQTAGHQQTAPEAPVLGRDGASVMVNEEQLRRSPAQEAVFQPSPPLDRMGSASRNAGRLRIREMPRSASWHSLRRR